MLRSLYFALACGLLPALCLAADARVVETLKNPLVVDENGQDAGVYCALQLMVRNHGVSVSTIDRELREEDPEFFVKWPYRVEKDSPTIRMTIQRASYLPFFPTMAIAFGEEFSWRKRLYFKKGYAPLLWASYSDSRNPQVVPMTKGDGELALERILSTQIDQAQLRALFAVIDPRPIVVDLTDDDRLMLRRCIEESGGQ